jgi:hypothetical protein
MIKKTIIFVAFSFFFAFAGASVAFAQSGTAGNCPEGQEQQTIMVGATPQVICTTTKLEKNTERANVTFKNPLGTVTKPQQLVGKIISAILGIIGTIALLMFIYGGFIWMTAAGNEKKVSSGRDILIWAAIGMAVVFTSYAAVKFLISDVIGA